MPSLENLKKQAKLLVRWHRDRYCPVAQRIRHSLPQCGQMNDVDILARRFTLAEAQELIAREHGFANWEALRAGLTTMNEQASSKAATPHLSMAYPQVYVTDMPASLAFFTEKLGFTVAFSYGEPAFFAQIRRDRARLNLHHSDGPVFVGDIRARESLLAAYIPVEPIRALYLEYQAAGVTFEQPLKQQPWGAQDFIVLDPDGNLIGFSSPTDLQD